MDKHIKVNCTVATLFAISIGGAHDHENSSESDEDGDEDSFGRTFSFWINGVLTMCLIVVGVVGNVAIIISLTCNTKKWLALYTYFITFSIFNTILLVSTVFVYCIPALRPDESEVSLSGYDDFIYLSLAGYGMANCGMTASIWLVLSLTVERYMAVIKPLHLISSTPKRRARFVVAAISILAPIYNIPLFFELRVTRTENGGIDIDKTSLRDHTFYKIAYRIIGNATFLSVVPLLSIIVMSLRIVYVVRMLTNEDRYNYFSENDHEYNLIDPTSLSVSYGHDRRRSSLSRCHHSKAVKQKTHRTHLTLAALATKFVLCYTLTCLLNILEIAVEPLTLTECGIGFMVDISNFLVICDSAANGLIYFSWRRNLANYYRKQQAPVVFAKLPPHHQQHGGTGGGAHGFSTSLLAAGGGTMQTHLSPNGGIGGGPLSSRRSSILDYGRHNNARSVISWQDRVSTL